MSISNIKIHELTTAGMSSKQIGFVYNIAANAVDCRNYRFRQIKDLPPKEITR